MRWSRTLLFSQILACTPQSPDSGGTTNTGDATATTGGESGSTGPTSGTPTGGGGSSDTTGQTPGATSEATANDDAGFLPRPDVSVHSECDPHAEMPCPEGEKCSASGRPSVYQGSLGCFPILGERGKGELCDLGPDPFDGLDDCAAHLVCSYFPGDPDGVCREFCDPPSSDETGSCSDPREFCFAPLCQSCTLSLCIPACDPLLGNCPAGQHCMESELAFACTEVQREFPGAGEPCDLYYYSCAAGAVCVASDQVTSPACTDSGACCASLCDLEAANTCPGKAEGETCQPYYKEPFDPQTQPWGVQYNRLGVCQLPTKP